MRRIEYKKGEIIRNCVYLKELDKRNGRRTGLFICPMCNKRFEATIEAVKCGKYKSCGCRKGLIKHNLSNHPLYKKWVNIKGRCYNPKNVSYKYYGARGIKMCDEWKNDFESFYDYISGLENYSKRGITIDRINNDGNYEPGNVRLVNMQIQILNRNLSHRNKSGYFGIRFRNDSNKWRSQITFNREVINLGSFKTKKNAIEVRNSYIINNRLPHFIQEYHG